MPYHSIKTSTMKFTITVLTLFVYAAMHLTSCGSAAKSMIDYPKDCSRLEADLDRGTLNGVPPTVGFNVAKTQFTCFTGETEEGSDFNCGGGVFFLDHQFFLYTHRDYIEMRKGFKGSVVQGLTFGMKRSDVVKIIGFPDVQPDVDTELYQKDYGTLRIEYRYGELDIIALHAVSPDEVELCR